MSECNIGNLNQSSKTGIAAFLIACMAAAGLTGGAIVFFTSTGTEIETTRTTLTVSVSNDFYLDVEAIVPLESSPHNCSSLMMGGQLFENGMFSALMAYLEANPSYSFNESEILDVLDLDYVQNGMHIEIIGDEFMSPESSNTSRLNGNSFDVDFGENAVLFFIEVGVYIDGDFEMIGFTFEGSNDFIMDVGCNCANYTSFVDANFLTGNNTMVINGMTIVEEGMIMEVETSLDVTFNGVDMLLPVSEFGFF